MLPHPIYLAGPMTGIEELNYPAFNAEAARLRALGYTVVNPAELDVPGLPYHECLKNSLRAMLQWCETVALLPDWEKSNGARIEVNLARSVQIRVVLASMIDGEL